MGLVTGDRERMRHELEVSQACKERMGHVNGAAQAAAGQGETLTIPNDILMRGWIPRNPSLAALLYGERAKYLSERALVDVGGAGNNEAAELVDTVLRGDLFIESLREEAVVLGMGVSVLSGLVGDVQIPRELTTPTMYWVGEDTEPTDGNWTADNVSLSLKTLAGRISFTDKAAKQSTPQVEAVLARAIRRSLAIYLDKALIEGSGSGSEPRGILNTSGIGSVTTSGTLTHALLHELEEDLGLANADTSRAQGLCNAHGKKVLMTTKKDAGSGDFLGSRVAGSNAVLTDIGTFQVTNNVPSDLGGGSDHAMLYGNFDHLLVGMWGGVELVRDTATKVATRGIVLRLFQDVDLVVDQPANFSAISYLAERRLPHHDPAGGATTPPATF
jgi:HK97 family phage major capsid protein